MPWRHDYVQCYWVDPDWAGFSGYPGDESQPSNASLEPTGPSHVRSKHQTHLASLASTNRPIEAAVTVVRDRIGFRYERVVGLDDFVSVREAAQLVGLPVMTLSRWIKSRRIRSRKRNGFLVLRLRDVFKVATERKGRMRIGGRLKVVG
jgi:excisionase family DNA binding protein